MSTPHPAYQFGLIVGAMKRAREEFARNLVAGFAAGMRGDRPLTSEQLEARREARLERQAERRHAMHLEAERRKGMAFIRREANRIRRELGLVDE